MAREIDRMEDFTERLVKVTKLLQEEFELTDKQVDFLIYNDNPPSDISFEEILQGMCGYPEWTNFN